MNDSVHLARKIFGLDKLRVVEPGQVYDGAGFQPVEIDITRISNDLWEQILREFNIQHGKGIYIRWQITALKGDTE